MKVPNMTDVKLVDKKTKGQCRPKIGEERPKWGFRSALQNTRIVYETPSIVTTPIRDPCPRSFGSLTEPSEPWISSVVLSPIY